MHAYVDLFAHAPTRWPLVTSSVSRITPGMILLAIVLLVEGAGYGYAAAGFVVAGHQAGVGVASPVQGRLADRLGQPVVLVPDAVLYLTGTAALAVATTRGASVALLTVLAAATGVFLPPVTACARVLLSTAFPSGRLRSTAFAVAGIAVELGFIVGPLVAVGVQQLVGARWAVVLAGAVAFVGAVGYASTAAARAVVPRSREGMRRGGALRAPGVVVVAASLGALAVVFGVLDIVLPAVASTAGRPWLAAPLIAAVASGSALGGLFYGARAWRGTAAQRLRLLVSVFALGLLLLPLTVGSLPVFVVALFGAGLFLGPTTITAFQLIDDLALPGTQTEAQSWTQSAIVVGVAAGAALSGIMVEVVGPARAFLLGAASVGASALLANACRRVLATPLRGSDTVVVEVAGDASS